LYSLIVKNERHGVREENEPVEDRSDVHASVGERRAGGDVEELLLERGLCRAASGAIGYAGC
jgi:hypothetical protein